VTWFDEALHDGVVNQGYMQRFEVTRVVWQKKTDFQNLIIFENPLFGRVLALDGVVQTTEADEFIYHEMLAHVPIIAHGTVRRVLIIGGGDGGVLREVLRHDGIERATLVEIDGTVIDVCREHLPGLGAGAFDDPRAKVVIADGVRFVAETDADFDVIIVDSTDPIGPGDVLFTTDFYADCKRCLTPGGVLVTQNGVPFLQPDEATTTWRRLAPLFADAGYYVIAVPTYIGGLMTLGWATDDETLRQLPEETVAARATGLETRYYAPAVHVASFALPPFITGLMTDGQKETRPEGRV
jgi:spermidine synthase